MYHGTYLGTEVAVKCFKNKDPAALKAFHTECEVMVWLREKGSHPNIIHMFGAYQEQRKSYIILELATNGNI